MSAKEKIAYLRGLIDGQKMADTPEKKKFYAALLESLDSLADSAAKHDGALGDIDRHLEQLDEDISSIEEDIDFVMGEDYDRNFDDECEYSDDEDSEKYESVICPHCEKEFHFNPELYSDDEKEELVCPHCGKTFVLPQE